MSRLSKHRAVCVGSPLGAADGGATPSDRQEKGRPVQVALFFLLADLSGAGE
jgi:hypothetical protein